MHIRIIIDGIIIGEILNEEMKTWDKFDNGIKKNKRECI